MVLLLSMLLLVLVLGAAPASPACPPEGDNPSPRLQGLDRLKNRATAPSMLVSVPLAAFLAPGDDRARWSQDQGVTVVGWVAEVKPGGLESVNCHAADLAHRDTHIVLVARPGDAPKAGIVIEVTPLWRAIMKGQGVDWSTPTLRRTLLHRWVQVQGFLFFDAEHVNASTNTMPHGVHNWRATAWEVHPVTGLKVLQGP